MFLIWFATKITLLHSAICPPVLKMKNSYTSFSPYKPLHVFFKYFQTNISSINKIAHKVFLILCTIKSQELKIENSEDNFFL